MTMQSDFDEHADDGFDAYAFVPLFVVFTKEGISNSCCVASL
jgi:hypothetical protein